MLQRKQTLFLLAAIIAVCCCLYFPLAHAEVRGMDTGGVLFNMAIKQQGAKLDFSSIPLFVIQVIAILLAIVTIFQYKQRKLQAKLCLACVLLQAVWYTVYAYIVYGSTHLPGTPHPDFAACLPLVSIVFLLMARRGILADEKLVRSMDRIR